MPAATFTLYDSFKEAPFEGVHNLATATLKVAFSNTAGDVVPGSHSQLSTITEVSYTNVVTTPNAGRVLGLTSSSQASGTYKLIIPDMTITATGGAIATFRYVIVYNDTATNKELIGSLDYGVGGVTLAENETLLLDFSDTEGLLQATG
jgi:hypothetical protein